MSIRFFDDGILFVDGQIAFHEDCCCPGPCGCEPFSGAPFSSIQVTFANVVCCIHPRQNPYCLFACPECSWINASFDLTAISDCTYVWESSPVAQRCAYASPGGCETSDTWYHKEIVAVLGNPGGAAVELVADLWGSIRLWTADAGVRFCYVNDVVDERFGIAFCPNSDDKQEMYGHSGTVTLTGVTPV